MRPKGRLSTPWRALSHFGVLYVSFFSSFASSEAGPSDRRAGAALLAAVPAFAQESTETVTVTAEKLAAARNGIQTQTGASTYTITAKDIQAQPGGDNAQLNSVILQMPGVAQDSFGQLHVRGEHNGLQYRLNGIILPEGISVFGQTLDPRLAESVRLITGALPAEYGNRTAGIIDIQTKSGVFENGGVVSMYGGSHSTLVALHRLWRLVGPFQLFRLGRLHHQHAGRRIARTAAAIRAMTAPSNITASPICRTSWTRTAASPPCWAPPTPSSRFPTRSVCSPPAWTALSAWGRRTPAAAISCSMPMARPAFPSENLDERQREITHYGILSYLHSDGIAGLSDLGFGRYSSLFFTPGNNVGDILYNGLAQTAYKRDVAYGLQAEGAWHAFHRPHHPLRRAVSGRRHASRTSSRVLATAPAVLAAPIPIRSAPIPTQTCQTSAVPLTIADNGSKHGYNYGFYAQDEWKLSANLTVNYGLRYDAFSAFDAENQLSPRINGVWKPTDTTTIHAGYARYFSPPPFELVASQDVALFDNTTAARPTTPTPRPRPNAPTISTSACEQKLFGNWTVGLDSFYKTSKNLIDEGQFGAPIILTPFNYAVGRQYGAEADRSTTRARTSPPMPTPPMNGPWARTSSPASSSSIPATWPISPTTIIPLDHQQIVLAVGRRVL